MPVTARRRQVFEEEEVRKKSDNSSIPRNLEPMSIDALQAYVKELEAEIKRVKAEIQRKQDLKGAADKVFG
jgi:uncharacterized small protein (DUF1192 family)